MAKLEEEVMRIYDYSRSKALSLIKNGFVYVNEDCITDRSKLINDNSNIFIKIPVLSIDILWKDENIAIVYKPSGIVTERCHTTDFTQQVMEDQLMEKLGLSKIFLLHRLDKETEGIMIVALNTTSYDHYKNIMKDRKFTKSYKAFYKYNNFKLNQLNSFICPHNKQVWSYTKECICNLKQQHQLQVINITEDASGPRISTNGNKRCETLMMPIYNGYNCILITGRTHQIRLTMKSMKRVISGDKIYGSKEKCSLQLFSYYIDIDKDYII
jgi:23S rRNA-/tRNA-specific pseudouridylate synthase